jgi:hypothetical protein
LTSVTNLKEGGVLAFLLFSMGDLRGTHQESEIQGWEARRIEGEKNRF